ncbi:MAG: hypothetical protein KKB13_21370, partial [Chloroflexi bacterium]|nr:hypothetical protein [Chloroflexota bacterium]
MEQVPCGHCHGSGQEWQSVDLNTGQVQYRTCSVCGGSGSVSVDRAYFSQYPDVSLRNALDLMQRHGQPVEICITDDDVRVLFGNGSRYVLGGFTVGYRGTGPDFAKRFLDAAGFDVSMDDIAGMKPPVTLTAGQSYVPQSPVAPAPTAAGEPRLEEAESGKAPPLISEAEPSPALASSRRGQVAGCLAGLLAVALVCLCGACCLGIGAMWLVRDSALQTTGRPASPKPATRTPGAVPTRMPGPPPPASPVPVMPTPGAVPTYRPELAPPVIPPFLQDKLPILQETFGTNARGWHQQGPTQVQVKNGQLCLTMGINDQHDIVWCADGCGPYPGSYYYQADLTLESVGDIECYYGLVFDLTDNDYYSFQILKDNNYHLAKSAG